MNQIEGNLKLKNFIGKIDEETYDQFPNVVVKNLTFQSNYFHQTLSNSVSDSF